MSPDLSLLDKIPGVNPKVHRLYLLNFFLFILYIYIFYPSAPKVSDWFWYYVLGRLDLPKENLEF